MNRLMGTQASIPPLPRALTYTGSLPQRVTIAVSTNCIAE
ncbi:MAG: hypothetical protein KatS3mg103_0409 [Phycisphaerales bacterium]|nr:MAG: hypothetical protein KatS3mg103_0409 [Phycisphaerales bacterium]